MSTFYSGNWWWTVLNDSGVEIRRWSLVADHEFTEDFDINFLCKQDYM